MSLGLLELLGAACLLCGPVAGLISATRAAEASGHRGKDVLKELPPSGMGGPRTKEPDQTYKSNMMGVSF